MINGCTKPCLRNKMLIPLCDVRSITWSVFILAITHDLYASRLGLDDKFVRIHLYITQARAFCSLIWNSSYSNQVPDWLWKVLLVGLRSGGLVNWWTFCHGLLCYCMVFSLLLSLYFVRFCFEGFNRKI